MPAPTTLAALALIGFNLLRKPKKEDEMSTNVIYARRISGDLYNVTFSYDSSCQQSPFWRIEQIAKEDRAIIQVNQEHYRGPGEPAHITIYDYAKMVKHKNTTHCYSKCTGVFNRSIIKSRNL